MLTAAAEAIPILCTNVGSLAEYIDDGCGWVVPNDIKPFAKTYKKSSMERLKILWHRWARNSSNMLIRDMIGIRLWMRL